MHITDMPIKCPVAPLEFAFLADDYFRRRGMRDRVGLVYATPLPGAFTKPIAASRLASMLEAAVNHWGKLAFRWLYWRALLPGRPLPLPSRMSMAGKHQTVVTK